MLSISPPDSSLVPQFLPGGPTSCANGVGHSGMSREPGKAGSAHSGWGGEDGVHTDIRQGEQGQGTGGWGQELGISWGPRQLLGLGSREGPGQMVIIVCPDLGKKGKTMLGPPKRGMRV